MSELGYWIAAETSTEYSRISNKSIHWTNLKKGTEWQREMLHTTPIVDMPCVTYRLAAVTLTSGVLFLYTSPVMLFTEKSAESFFKVRLTVIFSRRTLQETISYYISVRFFSWHFAELASVRNRIKGRM